MARATFFEEAGVAYLMAFVVVAFTLTASAAMGMAMLVMHTLFDALR